MQFVIGAVNDHKKALLAFPSLNLDEIDEQVANGVIFEFLFQRTLPGFAQRQAADAGALKAPMQHQPRQVQNDGLQRIWAIVQCQQCLPTKGHGNGFLRDTKHR